MSTNYYVYEHWTPDGYVYVGQTNNPMKRWESNGIHYKDSSLGDYIERFGWDNITHTVVAEFDNREDAILKEGELIDYYREQGCCINIKSSGINENDPYRKQYFHNWYIIHKTEQVSRSIKYYYEHKDRYEEARKRLENKLYNRVYQYNIKNPNQITITPLEAKQNYLKFGIVPSFIKHDDLDGTLYDPSDGIKQLSLF